MKTVVEACLLSLSDTVSTQLELFQLAGHKLLTPSLSRRLL